MEINPIPEDININQWKQKFKKWKESASTSPSGIHLGHYKAMLEVIHEKSGENIDLDPGMAEDQNWIINLHLRIANIELKTRRSLQQWQRANNICIPKKKTAEM